MSIKSELIEITDIAESEGQDFLREVMLAANKVSDEDWAKLSEPAQNWVNAGSFCHDTDRELPDFEDEDAVNEILTEMEAAEAKAEEKAALKSKSNKGKKATAKAKAVKEPVVESKSKKKVVEKTAKSSKSAVKAKATKVAKTHTNGTGAGRGRKGSFPLDARIVLKVKENPHRKGTTLYKMFEKYKSGMTVQQALDAGVVWANLRYLSELEHIKIG